MKKKLFLAAAVSIVLSAPVAAYDGLERDMATCIGGKSIKQQVVEACSRLIANAKAENSMVGMFYGMRAAHNDDRNQNCLDARKSLSLADSEPIRNASRELIKVNC